jgi:hypothetical protein
MDCSRKALWKPFLFFVSFHEFVASFVCSWTLLKLSTTLGFFDVGLTWKMAITLIVINLFVLVWICVLYVHMFCFHVFVSYICFYFFVCLCNLLWKFLI